MKSTRSDIPGSEGTYGAGARADGQSARAPLPTRTLRVLVVEDEPALLRALRINLHARGYDVVMATNGRTALTEATRHPPDAVLLDLGLPDVDGTEVIRGLRAWSSAPVIVLSGRAGSGDKIGALDAGADDYVTKPFSMEELLARLRAALRREDHPPSDGIVRIGRYDIDLAAYTVSWHASPDTARTTLVPEPGAGADLPHLTPTEWRLLEILLRAPGQLISSDRLLTEVWGPVSREILITCDFTWPGCGGNWRKTRRGRGTC